MDQLTGPELLEFAASSPAKPLLLDVREAWEFELAAIRIEGLETRHIPMNEIPGRLATLGASQPIVCICHHGVRSAQVVAFLAHHGYPAVYNLAGGIDAWSIEADASVPRY